MGFGTEQFFDHRGRSTAAMSLLERLMTRLVDRYVTDKLYKVVPIDLAANGTFKIDTGAQKLTLAYISVYSGTLDLYDGDRGRPAATALPLTRVTPTGFPVPFALPPDAYVFTVHASQSAALRACVILTSA